MKSIAAFLMFCTPLVANSLATEMTESLVGLTAVEARGICKRELLGKNHDVVRKLLGVSDLNHGEEEYTYHPVRRDGSVWILLVEFDGDRVDDVFTDEILPPQKKKEPNQALQPTPQSRRG